MSASLCPWLSQCLHIYLKKRVAMVAELEVPPGPKSFRLAIIKADLATATNDLSNRDQPWTPYLGTIPH